MSCDAHQLDAVDRRDADQLDAADRRDAAQLDAADRRDANQRGAADRRDADRLGGADYRDADQLGAPARQMPISSVLLIDVEEELAPPPFAVRGFWIRGGGNPCHLLDATISSCTDFFSA